MEKSVVETFVMMIIFILIQLMYWSYRQEQECLLKSYLQRVTIYSKGREGNAIATTYKGRKQIKIGTIVIISVVTKTMTIIHSVRATGIQKHMLMF